VTIVARHQRRPGGLSERTMPHARAPGQDGPVVTPVSEADDPEVLRCAGFLV
jgi:hypothetical protein